MTTLERHECLASLVLEWEQMPDGEPARRERWFTEVACLIAGIESVVDRQRWIKEFGRAIHERHEGLPESICTYIVQQRVEAAQKGGCMNFVNYRPNHRLAPVAACGTAEEVLGKPDDDFIPTSYRRYDRMIFSAACVLGLFVLCVAFYPVILGWMTPFKYGVLAGAVGMAALLIGGVAIGVCLGAANLEKRR